MFSDLNIRVLDPSNAEPALESVAERLMKYGYRKVAFTVEVDDSLLNKNKDNKKDKDSKKKSPGNPDCNSILPTPPDLTKLKGKFSKICFYNRLNLKISDSINVRKFLHCKNINKYDIISFEPEDQSVLKLLTSISQVDIISYNPENKFCLSFNRKLYNQFVNQNVFFELLYSPAIRDSTARKNLLVLAHTFKAIGKSKNIIVSSGAENAAYIRGPYDVINFNLLFGLSEEQSKMSITKNCERLLLRARKQRRHKSTVEMVMDSEDAMQVDGVDEKDV